MPIHELIVIGIVFLLVLIDYITGVVNAIMQGELSSKRMREGLGHKFAYLAAQSHYGELLVHRVKIYIYEPGLLHGKTVLSDGEAAFVGSVNMDYRSFQLHFECGTVLYGVPAIEGLAEDIQRITDRSRRVTYQEWKSRPWYRKLLSTLLRLFEMWM